MCVCAGQLGSVLKSLLVEVGVCCRMVAASQLMVLV